LPPPLEPQAGIGTTLRLRLTHATGGRPDIDSGKKWSDEQLGQIKAAAAPIPACLRDAYLQRIAALLGDDASIMPPCGRPARKRKRPCCSRTRSSPTRTWLKFTASAALGCNAWCK
jgi:hypothetical protein